MDDCKICYETKSLMIKAKKCGHEICVDCLKSLEKEECPFCRQGYTYNELQYRSSSQCLNENREISRRSLNLEVNEPFSRVERNMRRRRRRNLSFDEVIERRQMIRRRMRLKWRIKNGRLHKVK